MTTNASDDEWEEVTVVAEAVAKGHVKLRDAATAAPILQISNSLYTGKWMRTVGTNIVLEAENNQIKIISTTDRMLKTEKALLTAQENTTGNEAADDEQPKAEAEISSS